MLGYVVAEGRGAADALLRDLAADLRRAGVSLAGAVQVNEDNGPDRKCHMDLHILSGADVVRISQDLGALSQGCRLDPAGLERAVGLVGTALAGGAQVLVVNKFGKQELDGRGFCPLIGEALAAEVPVLVAVNGGNLAGFERWSGGYGERIAPTPEALRNWAARHGLGTAESLAATAASNLPS